MGSPREVNLLKFCLGNDQSVVERLGSIPGIVITVNDDEVSTLGGVYRSVSMYNRAVNAQGELALPKIWAIMYSNPADFREVNKLLKESFVKGYAPSYLVKKARITNLSCVDNDCSAVPMSSRYVHVQDLRTEQQTTGARIIKDLSDLFLQQGLEEYIVPENVIVWSTLAAGRRNNLPNLPGLTDIKEFGIIPAPKDYNTDFNSDGPGLIRDVLGIVGGNPKYGRIN